MTSPVIKKQAASTSPSGKTYNDPNFFGFAAAVAKFVAGKKVTKQEWGNPLFYGVLRDGKLELHKPDGKFYDWVLSEGDLTGDDFTVIE